MPPYISNILLRWQWVFFVGLCTSIFALGLVSVDRTHLPLVVGLVVFGSICWVVCWRWGRFNLKTIIGYAILFRLALFGIPPSLSDDAYRYVWDGLIQHHGVNPYQYTPEEAPQAKLKDDLTYERLNSKSYVSVYPPVSQLIFRLGTTLHQPDGFLSYYLIKGILVLAELLAIYLLARVVSAGFVLLYAWNPVVILETAAQSHTESLLLLSLGLVIYLVGKNHVRWASIFLAVAGWIKLFPFFFFPFLWRRYGWRSVWPGVLIAVLLSVPFAAPYVLSNVMNSLDLYVRSFEFNSGLYYILKEIMRWITGDDWSKQLGPFLRLIFLGSLPLLYIMDKVKRWSLPQAMLITTGGYLLLTTTVHPWYLLVPLFLFACTQTRGWNWIWLGVCSVGTYLLYADGPYWTFVIAGWTGWAIMALIQNAPNWIQSVMRSGAACKFKNIRPYLPYLGGRSQRVLDLGCAEGYVGESIQNKLGASVTLADVVLMNRTELPHSLLESDLLPWDSNHFDVVLLYYVLHHTKDSEALLREAMRVCRGRVIVVESVYSTVFQYRLLTILDRFANRLRSYGKMNAQEEFLKFRTSREWRELFHKRKVTVLAEFGSGFGPFMSAGFVLQPSPCHDRKSKAILNQMR